MIHKNWAELIKPTQLEVRPGADPSRVATVVAELVAKYTERIPGRARLAIVETLATIGQEQQWAQRYEHLAPPGKSHFGETEASGYFIFNASEDEDDPAETAEA